jgi:hypothetical protein
MARWLLVLIVLLLSGPALAQEAAMGREAEVTLIDGSTVYGRIVREDDTLVVLESDSLGTMRIPRERIRGIEYETAQPSSTSNWREDPDRNSLLLAPTAETLPQGDVYYRNFMILFNNLGYAVTDDLNLSVMAAFPVTSDVRIVSLGAKFRLVSRDRSPVSLATAFSTWIVDDENLSTVSGIMSAGNSRRSFTAAVNYGFADGDGELFFLLGADLQVGAGTKLIAEYGNSESAISDENDFKGILNVGFRLFWENVSFTLTGFRPLEETGEFIAFPLAMFSAHF